MYGNSAKLFEELEFTWILKAKLKVSKRCQVLRGWFSALETAQSLPPGVVLLLGCFASPDRVTVVVFYGSLGNHVTVRVWNPGLPLNLVSHRHQLVGRAQAGPGGPLTLPVAAGKPSSEPAGYRVSWHRGERPGCWFGEHVLRAVQLGWVAGRVAPLGVGARSSFLPCPLLLSFLRHWSAT